MKSISAAIVFFLLSTAAWVHAGGTHPRGIKLDGTVGNTGKLDLSGPDYEIKAEYGRQAGANLFHSFEQFNLYSDERAAFKGPDSVQNIIARVTGGNASWIDGKIRSEIPGADLYLLNPAGIMFGANAALDIRGSFHISTADFLRLGENERFYAIPNENDMLSAAPPTAFGFLDGDAGKISFEGQGELTSEIWGEKYDNWYGWWTDHADSFFPGLSVPKGETISVIGGDIRLKGTYFINAEEGPILIGANLSAPQGQVFMASLQSAGEVQISDSGIATSLRPSGNITLSDGAKITVNDMGDPETLGGSGSVFIRSGMFVMENYARIESEAYNGDGKVIDIDADKITLQNKALIGVNARKNGDGTNIKLTASEEITITGLSLIENGSYRSGNGGTVSIKAQRVSISDSSNIGGDSYLSGKGGDIEIEASESLRISDEAWIATSSTEWSTAKGGDIRIDTPVLNLENKASIASSSEGKGKGGNIVVNADEIKISEGGVIYARTEKSGLGGNITLSGSDPARNDDLAESVKLSGSTSAVHAGTGGTGNAGAISIAAKELSLSDKASVTTSASDTGNAGEIKLNVGNLRLDQSASVASASTYPDSKIYTAPDIPAAMNMIPSTKEGDMIIVQDVGDGTSALAVRAGFASWIPISGNISTVDTLAELSALPDSTRPSDGEGNTVIVKDGGNGNPAAYVYDGHLMWIKIKNCYTVDTVAQREGFIAMPGDVVQIAGSEGNPVQRFTYTGKEWITYKKVYSAPDIEARDALTVQKGDVVKMADTGKSFLFDGEKWIIFYMTGNAGTLTVTADETVTLKDDSTLSTASAGGIRGGIISLNASSLQANDRATITSGSEAVGDAGTIALNAGNIRLSDDSAVTTMTTGQGKGGDITVEAGTLDLDKTARISSESLAESDGGDAGTIAVKAEKNIRLFDSGALTTEAKDAGGGHITLNTQGLLYLNSGEITTSVRGGDGNGGNITIGNPQFVTLNHGNIKADAYEGRGGNIHIVTDQFISSSDSSVTASSQLGIDGSIEIESPDEDISEGLTLLPDNFMDVSRWLRTPCSARSAENMSRFTAVGRDAVPAPFDDWLAIPPIW